jgi:hypothetical protein
VLSTNSTVTASEPISVVVTLIASGNASVPAGAATVSVVFTPPNSTVGGQAIPVLANETEVAGTYIAQLDGSQTGTAPGEWMVIALARVPQSRLPLQSLPVNVTVVPGVNLNGAIPERLRCGV